MDSELGRHEVVLLLEIWGQHQVTVSLASLWVTLNLVGREVKVRTRCLCSVSWPQAYLLNAAGSHRVRAVAAVATRAPHQKH